MADRDSTKTPVAAEALIAAAALLALQRIPRGAPPQLPAAPAPLGRALRGVPRRALSSAPSARLPAAAPERSTAVQSRGAPRPRSGESPRPGTGVPGGARSAGRRRRLEGGHSRELIIDDRERLGAELRAGAGGGGGARTGRGCQSCKGPARSYTWGALGSGTGGTNDPETLDLRELLTAGSKHNSV